MAKVDIAALQALADEHVLTGRKHPDGDLLVWNYTPKAQYDRIWTPETLMCRGLITRSDGTIVSRPFRKFFNLDEYVNQGGQLPVEPFEVTEKMDGSLGVTYMAPDGQMALATRGSFGGEQALRGTEILRRLYGDFAFDPDYTYLFEIVYPENRIVVDYGVREDIVLLAKIHTETGQEVGIWDADWPMPVVRRYDGIRDVAELLALEEPNREGFVIRFLESNLRLKVKFEEYKRLHRLLTQMTARTIWEQLAAGSNLDAVLDRVPDEFYAWVRATEAGLRSEYARIEVASAAVLSQVAGLASRKEQAQIITKTPYPGVVFKMLDAKPYAEVIWKLLRPEAEKPFREDI